MATDAQNLTAAPENLGDNSPTKTLDAAAKGLDQVNGSSTTTTTTTTENSAVNGSKKSCEDSKAVEPVTDTEKKIRRAERFGITVQLSEEEKRNSRAERFGTASSANDTDASKKSEELKRKARAERFGIPTPPLASNDEVKKKARLERFASTPKPDALEEDKRKARAARFSQPPSNSLSINGKGNIDPKTPIEGKAGGVS